MTLLSVHGILWEAVNKLSHIYKASPIFTSHCKSTCFFPSLVLSSWIIPCEGGSTCIPLATVRVQLTLYILLSLPMFPHILGSHLFFVWKPRLFLSIRHVDKSREGTGVGVKNKPTCVWVLVLLLGVYVNLDKWLTTLSLSFFIC